MRLAALALASALPAASSAEAPTAPALPAEAEAAAPAPARAAARFVPTRLCEDAMKPRHARNPEAVKPRRLGELPSGDLTLAVVNRVGDCMEPVVVRQGVGDLGGR